MKNTVYVRGERYFLYETYNTREKAHKIAKAYKKMMKNKYYIVTHDAGYLFPMKKHTLYMTKVVRLGLLR